MVAADEGYWDRSLADADTPGLTIAAGEVLGEAEDGCGLQSYTSMVFMAYDDEVELSPWGTGEVLAGGTPTRVWAVASSSYVRMDCTDLGDTFARAIAR